MARENALCASFSLSFLFLVGTVGTVGTSLILLGFFVPPCVPPVPTWFGTSVDGWPRPLVAVDADLKQIHYRRSEL